MRFRIYLGTHAVWEIPAKHRYGSLDFGRQEDRPSSGVVYPCNEDGLSDPEHESEAAFADAFVRLSRRHSSKRC